MSKFDKDLKVGDLVVTYEKGFFKVERVEQRFYTQADLDRMSYFHPNVNPTNIKLGHSLCNTHASGGREGGCPIPLKQFLPVLW